MITQDTTVSILKRCIESLEALSFAWLGSRSIKSVVVANNNQYDRAITVPANTNGEVQLTVKAITQNPAIIDFNIMFRVNDPDVYGNPVPPITGYGASYYIQHTPYEGTSTSRSYRLAFFNITSTSATFYIKAYAEATDLVSFQFLN